METPGQRLFVSMFLVVSSFSKKVYIGIYIGVLHHVSHVYRAVTPNGEKTRNMQVKRLQTRNTTRYKKQTWRGGRIGCMSAPLSSGRPGRSEMSHGDGAYPHPESDYQSQRALVFGQGEDARDANRDYRAQKRLDATNPLESVDDMLYVLGNPDGFGPGPKLVKEKKRVPTSVYKQPQYRYGVNRQE